MKKRFSILLVSTVIIGVIFSLVGIVLTSQAKLEPMQRKIVVFKSGVLNEPDREALVKKFGGVKTKDLTLIDGKAVLLSPKAEAALSRQAGVLRIDDDVVVEALVRGQKGPAPAPQPVESLPWGVDRIDAERVWLLGNTADLIKVGIIDTGISNTHPDLLANVKGGVNTINPLKNWNWNDDNGHGSHVAGIVGAIDNTFGVIGVGPKIDLYAIKVLGASGSGWLSDIIEGLDWAINNGMQVVNMSLGTSVYNASFEAAVKKVYDAGIVQVAAAGNSGPDDNTVIYPAKFTEVIAVSATDQNDVIAWWSSRGPQVDLAAPGVDINSTYKGTGYATLSGTSMAAPHVAGSAALVLNTQVGTYDASHGVNPPNGKWDPDEVQKRLQDTAEVLPGLTSNQQGYGLVDALAAVTQ